MSAPETQAEGEVRTGRAALAAVLGWAIPGLGHLVLGRYRRALAFFAIVTISFAVGCWLEGNLYRPVAGQPLTRLATLGAMGVGTPYICARWQFDYSGSPEAAGYEYGTAFLLTAGLMNLLLVLDAWDIGVGKKD